MHAFSAVAKLFVISFARIHKSSHITRNPGVISLHWLKINERAEYKRFSLTHEVLETAQPNFISVQPSPNILFFMSVSLEYQPAPL